MFKNSQAGFWAGSASFELRECIRSICQELILKKPNTGNLGWGDSIVSLGKFIFSLILMIFTWKLI